MQWFLHVSNGLFGRIWKFGGGGGGLAGGGDTGDLVVSSTINMIRKHVTSITLPIDTHNEIKRESEKNNAFDEYL